MPSPATTDLPIPKSWDEFEDICADLLKHRWGDPYVTRHGRPGQKQSLKHWDRYVNKFSGRQNMRRKDTIDQMISVVEQMESKRLRYQDLILDET